MEHKKKKDIKKKINRDSLLKSVMMLDDNIQTAVGNDGTRGINNRSRVRIMGRLGITDDDRYVLKCAATVDDEPVATDYTEIKRNLSPIKLVFDKNGRVTKIDQFSNQNNIAGDSNCRETQTQADFDFNFDVKKRRKDQIIQCEYNNSKDDRKIYNTVDDKSNPFVVISVYPQPSHDNIIKNAANSTSDTNRRKKGDTVPKKGAKDNKSSQSPSLQPRNKAVSKLSTTSSRSNSPKQVRSPTQLISGNKVNDISKVNKPNISSRTSSLSRETALVGTIKDVPKRNRPNSKLRMNSPTRGQSKPSDTKPGNKMLTKLSARNKSPNKPPSANKTNKTGFASRTNSPSPRRVQEEKVNKSSKAKMNSKQTKISNISFNKSRSGSPKRQPNTKTKLKGGIEAKLDQELTKKAIVDDYTKAMTAQMSRGQNELHDKLPISMTNPSKVSINIDGEKERYDVLFAQNMQTTNVTICKTLKPASRLAKDANDYPFDDTKDAPSKEPRKRSLTDAIFNPKADAVQRSNSPTPSRFSVQDSIKIKHRRDERISQRNIRIGCDFSDYRELPNPVERDKEIQQLPGVNNKQRRSKKEQAVDSDLVSVQYLFKRTKKTKGTSTNKKENKENDAEATTPCKVSCKVSINKDLVSERKQGDINKSSVRIKHCYLNCNIKKKESSRNESLNSVSKTQLSPNTEYKQMILNHNTQIFLQIEQFTKDKPIVLTKYQYEKVKQIIKDCRANTKRETQKNIVSLGSVKMNRAKSVRYLDAKAEDNNYDNNYAATTTYALHRHKYEAYQNRVVTYQDTLVLLNASDNKYRQKKVNFFPKGPLVEDVNGLSLQKPRQIEFSSSNDAKNQIVNTTRKISNCSIHTIFKRNKNHHRSSCVTSNHSLQLADHKGDNNIMNRKIKSKKTLLNTILSCVVLKCNPSFNKLKAVSKPALSECSSCDYHINSSMMGTDIDSDMYDTSASFYSNHSIHPNEVTRKHKKKGIFSILREHLLKI